MGLVFQEFMNSFQGVCGENLFKKKWEYGINFPGIFENPKGS